MKEKLQKYFDELSYYMGNYWRFITILSLTALLWLAYELHEVKSAINKNTVAVKQSNKYAVMVNTQNQIRGFEKEKLTDETYKFMIAGIVERYLVKSAYDLVSRSGTKKFKDYNEFFDAQLGSGGLKEFYYNFIFTSNKNKDKKILALEKEGQQAFLSLIKKYFFHLRKKEIPLAKDTLGVNLEDISYFFNEDTFKITVKIRMITAGVTIDGIAYKNIPQTAKFELAGYIDVDSTHPVLNPLGIRFNKIVAYPVLTPNNVNTLKVNMKNSDTNKKATPSSGSTTVGEKRY